MAKQSLYTIGYTSFVHNSEVDIERMMLTLRQLQVNFLKQIATFSKVLVRLLVFPMCIWGS